MQVCDLSKGCETTGSRSSDSFVQGPYHYSDRGVMRGIHAGKSGVENGKGKTHLGVGSEKCLQALVTDIG
jgi:hypothetical protein